MIDKNQIFPPNELFEFKTDSRSINRIEDRIRQLELAIKYTRHTVKLNQNKRNLKVLEQELKMSIYHHNKFDLFEVISREIDKRIKKEFDEMWRD